MVNYKTQYLAMKLKYINAKNNLLGGSQKQNTSQPRAPQLQPLNFNRPESAGKPQYAHESQESEDKQQKTENVKAVSSGISINLPNQDKPNLHIHTHQHGKHKHNHGHWHTPDPKIDYSSELSIKNHIEKSKHSHTKESYFNDKGKKETKYHPEFDIVSRSSSPSSSPRSRLPSSMSKVSSDILVAKQALMSIGLTSIDAEIALENSNGDLNMVLSNLVSTNIITPFKRRSILKGQLQQQQGNVTSVALQDMYQQIQQQPQQPLQSQELEDKPNIVESLFESEVPLVNPQTKLNIDESKVRGKNVNCTDYHNDKDSCLAIPNCMYTISKQCRARKYVGQGKKEYQGPIRKYI
jgi:hypothetical protein